MAANAKIAGSAVDAGEVFGALPVALLQATLAPGK